MQDVACGNGSCQSGENCGNCPADCPCSGAASCYNSSCCTPQCAGKQCGTNACGGSCGTCSGTLTCNGNGQCVGCGDGTCASPENCATCPADCGCSGTAVCYNSSCCTPDPNACDQFDECGSRPNGCGGNTVCGTCPPGLPWCIQNPGINCCSSTKFGFCEL
ncbi:MAG TPA: hypothetical protein PKA88_06530 [Polyangiaceae bacterium]|nr:hypothetical protein [Polyangiaceae bacterium]